MRIVWRYLNFIDEGSAELFNRSSRRRVRAITSQDHCWIDRLNERFDRATSLISISLSTVHLRNLKPDMAGDEFNVCAATDAKIDMARVTTVIQDNAEVIIRRKAFCLVAGNNSDENK